MYRAFFGIETKPFSIVPDERFLFMSERHREALAHLIYGVRESGGFVMLSGDVGTGKTLISRCLVADLGKDIEVALCLNPRVTDLELLANICDELGIDYPQGTTSRKDLVDRITDHLLDAYANGRRVLLIIDEAQDLEPDVLEQVRLLTNLETGTTKLLQIVLIGQQELLEILGRTEMRQVAQRITARYHLKPLSRKETEGYIRHRLGVVGMNQGVFKPKAMQEIYAASDGVPRVINMICDRALLGAYACEQKVVDVRLARNAAAEVLGRQFPPMKRRWRLLPWLAGAGAAAAALVALVAVDVVEVGMTRAEWMDRAPEPIRAALLLLSGGADGVGGQVGSETRSPSGRR